jgi:hypothetical protein
VRFSTLFAFICFFPLFSIWAQTHTSVSLDQGVYYLLEQAQIRGLCAFLPSVKPYSREQVLAALDEILASDAERRFGTLTKEERHILEKARKSFEKPSAGLNWRQGEFFTEHTWDRIRFSGDIAFTAENFFSAGIYPTGESAWATEHWFTIALKGDIGETLSFNYEVSGGILRSPRSLLGTYNTYYPDFTDTDSHINQTVDSYSEPIAYFPYTYKKRWDAFVWYVTQVDNSGQQPWPQELSIGYAMFPELGGTLFNSRITYRFARLDREWGGMAEGTSLALNQYAQPFVALETSIRPFTGFGISALAGGLEYYNAKSIKDSAESKQNVFSIAMLEFNYKNYFHLDAGSSTVWIKRFELDYFFHLGENTGLFLNLKGQYPGLGKLWFSVFLDSFSFGMQEDKTSYAFQAGAGFAIPIFQFTSVTASYTKIEPYCYTNTREFAPDYGSIPMETSYVNNGRSIGSYLPPNSDELLIRFETMPTLYTQIRFQYQMIRRGADFGSSAVDGSSLLSELDPAEQNEKPILQKYFLRDGAYQWMHIVKLGAEYSLSRFGLPLTLLGEAGVVFSYFTNIAGEANAGEPSAYQVIDTPEYPRSIGIIFTAGIKLFL